MKSMERMERKISRRQLLKVAREITIGVSLLGAFGYAADKTYDRLKNYNALTSEQERAMKLLDEASDQDIVHNAIAMGDREGDQVIPVNLRDRPQTPKDKDDFSYGRVVGKLEQGAIVKRAVVVLGNDRNRPMDQKSNDLWYAFQNPDKPNQIVFASSTVFAPSEEALRVRVFDVGK